MYMRTVISVNVNTNLNNLKRDEIDFHTYLNSINNSNNIDLYEYQIYL